MPFVESLQRHTHTHTKKKKKKKKKKRKRKELLWFKYTYFNKNTLVI